MEEPHRGIHAFHTACTVTVYQAYSPGIGLPALRDGRFPAAWKRGRMTWVMKPRSQHDPWCRQHADLRRTYATTMPKSWTSSSRPPV
ncbi:DUF4291 family protein [Streptomyces avermitilis]|uniref:DUF4291 family protein n=1 Tax=Streptomyces avermitilis TaxID=33903 RepID=UPI003675ABB2